MNRQAYIDWIKEVRGKMSKVAFGQKIYHYKNENSQKVCATYHRNEIANWENGKSLPMNVESFISIALLDFDQQHPNLEKTIANRNLRFQYVQEKMLEILGLVLYCRSVHDVLMIQVCRGILDFFEVLELEPKLDLIVCSASVVGEKKREYALKKETENIAAKVFLVKDREELNQIVEDFKELFYTGIRTFGERMQACYEKKIRYVAPLSLAEAVQIYAPNYRDSFNRIFTSSGMTRQWILDLCVHLRLDKNELEYILENAHFAALSEDEIPENLSDLSSLGFVQKMQIAMLLCVFVRDIASREEFVPVDYLFDSFLRYEYGNMALKQVQNIQKGNTEKIEKWRDYIQLTSISLENENMRKVYQDYCNEFKEYDTVSQKLEFKQKNEDKIEIEKLKYFAALLYTIFTGRYYKGFICEGDLMQIKAQFQGQCKDWKAIYNFINQYLLTFLGESPLQKDKYECYFCEINQKKMNSFNFEEVYSDLSESIPMLSVK